MLATCAPAHKRRIVHWKKALSSNFVTGSNPIDATSNVNDTPVWINVSPDDFLDHSTTPFKIAGTNDTKLWSEITSYISGSFTDPTVNGKQGFRSHL